MGTGLLSRCNMTSHKYYMCDHVLRVAAEGVRRMTWDAEVRRLAREADLPESPARVLAALAMTHAALRLLVKKLQAEGLASPDAAASFVDAVESTLASIMEWNSASPE